MYIISFRDLAAAKSGAVTPAAVFWIDGVGADFAWNDPASLRRRFADRSARYVPWDEVRTALAGKHVCFVIHGFNVGRDDGYASCGALSQQLSGQGKPWPDTTVTSIESATGGVGLLMPVLWPGDGLVPGISYPTEMGDVYETGRRFAEFLLSEARGLSRASFISHSLGARVVLETVQRTMAAGKGVPPRFETAVLTAPAADDGVLDEPRYGAAVAALRRIVIVSSQEDDVLEDVFPAGDRVESWIWSRERASKRALGYSGPRKLKKASPAAGKLEWFDATTDSVGHDGYFPTPLERPDAKWATWPRGWTRLRAKQAGFLHTLFGGGEPAWPTKKTVEQET